MIKNTYFFALLVLITAACAKKVEEKPEVKAPTNQISFTDEQLKYIEIATVSQIPAMDEFAAVGEVSFDENNVVRVLPDCQRKRKQSECFSW
ncbi:MAG: hypothetical protein WDN75_03970 [Bacteroidota bacterium]